MAKCCAESGRVRKSTPPYTLKSKVMNSWLVECACCVLKDAGRQESLMSNNKGFGCHLYVQGTKEICTELTLVQCNVGFLATPTPRMRINWAD
ncbi:uncharacterized protein PHALS_00343 [Plasmopara halstedii]|uniref:Uncharacterized protein n=1 Tax=Plasmopara halstedii TaxID=4781 RepID=A0A0P1A700_PLAHL|nr:uncharacterized protein PHALS_00343 [Plasmopara halstedii]CEG36021.1 hypothetical protein PHALS_00343 [Plasmopara halstedii]|eukprot:XP_024572390.1 hypothetical protein PHALS_00343 [Plasmopara halstedii]